MRVHLFGNRQATVLRKMIAADHPGWHLSSIEFGAPGDDAPDPVIPPLPSILHHLGLPDAEPRFAVGDRFCTCEEYLDGTLRYYQRLLPRDLRQALASSRGQELFDAFGGGNDYGHGLLEAMGPAEREQARQWLRGIFAAVLGRSLTEPELALHLQAVQDSGVTTWMSYLADTPEFRARVAPETAGVG